MSEETPISEGSGGFEVETGGELDGGIGSGRQPMAPKRDKRAERSANVKNTFGQGPGRIALIAIGLILLLFVMIGIRSCTHKDVVAKSDAQVDVPGAPSAGVSTKPVSAAEMKRHDEQAQKEAAEAHAAGQDYQQPFDPVIAKNRAAAINDSGAGASFDVGGMDTPHSSHAAGTTAGQGSNTTNAPPSNGLVAIGGVAPANSGNTNNAGGSGDASDGEATNGSAATAEQTPEQQKAQQDAAEKAHQDAYNKAVADRDTYVDKNRQRVIDEAEEILGEGKDGQDVPKYNGYRSFAYTTDVTDTARASATAGDSTKSGDSKSSQSSEPKGPPLIKTGNSLYITTNSMVNTDAGGQVFATVQGGTWSGSQVICDIQQAPNNIRAHCTTLAPQDSRPTMKIDAVLLRESDMSQGIAESIDHHTISRYTALAVASLLQGYGEAYSYQQGTSVVTANGTVLQTSDEPSTKQVVGRALGQVGSNAGAEIQKGFDRPTTYSTPANQGMILYFLSDAYASTATQQ
jgi:intracellular multiplication protein IcmE